MPTPEEIKKIAREFAEYSLSEEKKMYDDETYQRLVDESSKGLFDVRYILQWISKDYYLVPKSKVKDEYEVAKSMIHSNKIIDQDCGIVRKSLMDYLFGTALFNEEKE